MLIAVRAEVESVAHWKEQFRTHSELFKSQGVSIAHMGATEGNKVIAVFETKDADAFIRIFNDQMKGCSWNQIIFQSNCSPYPVFLKNTWWFLY